MKKIIKNLGLYLFLPLIIAIIFFVLQDWFQDIKIKFLSQKPPYVAVLISKESIDFDIPKDFIGGFFEEETNPVLAKNGKKVELKHFEDFLSEAESSRQLEKLIADKNCLLIICNANSTLTNSNIDLLMSAEKVPIIMPIATDNIIMKKTKSVKHNGILRILPDNQKQAETICQFINAEFRESKNIVIYGDEDNRSYSINLSRIIADRLRKGDKRISIQELIGPSNSIASTISFLKNANVIVYVGVSHHASLLIDQLSLLELDIPLIMTDGCLVASIFSTASQKYEDKCYIASPAILNNENQFISPYKVIGKDTYQILKGIISETFPTRKNVYETIEGMRNEGKKFTCKDNNNREEDIRYYEFNSEGNNVGEYFMYPITEGRLGERYKFPNTKLHNQ